MCGFIARTGSEPIPPAALDALACRGPDDRGLASYGGASLGQTRLAIIDLSPGGHQPMQDAERKVAITFNGEIYNYRELRKELEGLGHRFRTQSDTEVILKAYLQWGEETPRRLDGMFAFVIWDEEQHALFFARDRFGKKPLYYAPTTDGGLALASEIKALLAMGIRPQIDPQSIDAYLALMYVPPWRTIHSTVQTLPGAHQAKFAGGKLTTRRYWQLEPKPLRISAGEAKEEVRRLLREAVRKRLIADVEIGSFLSGGVDSTLVTAYAQQQSGAKLKTFSLGYGSHIDELPFAEQASRAIGTDHFTLQASSRLTDELEAVAAYFDEPHADSSNFPQHLVSRLAAGKVKVALSGDGGDELFMGYPWYSAHWRRPLKSRLKMALLSDPYREYLKSVTFFSPELRAELRRDPSAEWREPLDRIATSALDPLQRINAFDLTTYLQGQLLTKVDRASMMHGLEVRCPLLDHQLAEFAFNLPRELKMNRATGKLILKDLLREVMPDAFVDRLKQGFGAPVREWLAEPSMRAYVEARLLRSARVHQFLREDALARFVKGAYASNDLGHYYRLWILLCLELWLRAHS